MGFCCEDLAAELEGRGKYASGLLQPRSLIERDADGSWNVIADDGCPVLDNIKFCPFCGAALPRAPQ